MPWAFLPQEISHILNTYTAPKYSHDRYATRGESTRSSDDRPHLEKNESSGSIRHSVSNAEGQVPAVVEAAVSESSAGGSEDRPGSAEKQAVKVKQERESV